MMTRIWSLSHDWRVCDVGSNLLKEPHVRTYGSEVEAQNAFAPEWTDKGTLKKNEFNHCDII